MKENLFSSDWWRALPRALASALRRPLAASIIGAGVLVATARPAEAQKQVERLNRGVVAVRISPTQVFVSWRLLGTDDPSTSFHVYRNGSRITTTTVANTNFVDTNPDNTTYSVRPIVRGRGLDYSEAAPTWQQQYLSIPIQAPAGGTTPSGETYTYSANDCSTGDLDGDGQYEIIVKWDPSNSKDNSQGGYTGNVYLDGYKLNGTRLWRIDLGRNIRAGAHYTQFMVYDFDGDGKAEIACKTADGTRDGRGTVVGSASADYRTSNGYILSGPEFLTMFNGQTGAAMATTNYLPARGTVSSWGDGYGNRVDRFVSTVAYLDGQRPSLIMGRGYYTRLVRVAWDWRNGQFTRRWTFDSDASGNRAYAGQGNHQLTTGDVDGDGKDEVINGASTINDDGTGQYSTGFGHGDALHMSDLNPDRPGQEIWQCQESPSSYRGNGLQMRDARTGQLLWGVPATGDVGRALTADIDPRYKGAECWGSAGGLYTCTGTQISTRKPSSNFAIWWDGDLSREILDGGTLNKWDANAGTSNRLFTIYNSGGATPINGTKANPGLTADLLGDWREEMVYRNSTSTSLLLFTTTIPTTTSLYTLMHDAQYRVAVAHENSAYNQPPHPSYYLGTGMGPLTKPNIVLAGGSTARTSNEAASASGLVAVYPNPAAGAFRIQAAGQFSYSVRDQYGKEVEQGKGEGEKAAGIQLKAGIYLVRIQTADNVETIRVEKR
ncbi:MAG: T9SS type A sorting domain-containing protein [Hymenobacter sp.]|nr:T9SS type A sorting domain-containing protein [Hymenobacter sp.]